MYKVCLINPPTSDAAGSEMYFPMPLLVLAGVLKAEGVVAELWDFEYYAQRQQRHILLAEYSELIRYGIRHAEMQVFCISSMCSNFPLAIWMAREIKRHQPTAVVIVGGPQPSSVYTELLTHCPWIDAVVVGEGEETLAELARAGFSREAFARIAGVATCIEGTIQFTARPLIKALDHLPMPDYSLINYEHYAPLLANHDYAHIEAGRGCPFTCTFCSTAVMWQRRFRMKSPARILEEAQWLHQHWGITHFDLIHDNWTTSARYVDEFCAYWKGHAHRPWRWYTASRTDCLTREQLDHMVDAGLGGIFFGIETGSARMQRIMDKGLELDGFEDFVRYGRRLGVGFITAFILGFPEELEADIDATIRLAIRAQVAGAQRSYLSTLAPLAGTRVYKENTSRMLLLPFHTSLSPLHTAEPEIQEMVARHPALFSFFYHVAHPLLPPEEFYALAQMANAMVTHVPHQAALLFDQSYRTPLQLFHRWNSWLQRRGGPTIANPWGVSFRRLFHEFLTSAEFPASVAPSVESHAASIMGGMLAGLDRTTATVFSFYLAIPTMAGATVVNLYGARHELGQGDLLPYVLGFGISFVVAWIAIRGLLRFISKNNFIPFGIYRLLIG